MQDELNDPRVRDTIEQAIARSFGAPHSFRITLAGADGSDAPGNGPRASRHNPVQDSHLLRTAIGLGARILEEQ